MLTPELVRTEMRLLALETFTTKFINAFTLAMSDDQFQLLKENVVRSLEKQTIPGVSPEASDLIASDYTDAILRLRKFVEGYRESK